MIEDFIIALVGIYLTIFGVFMVVIHRDYVNRCGILSLPEEPKLIVRSDCRLYDGGLHD
jgi:hypothetical protein